MLGEVLCQPGDRLERMTERRAASSAGTLLAIDEKNALDIGKLRPFRLPRTQDDCFLPGIVGNEGKAIQNRVVAIAIVDDLGGNVEWL